MSTVEAPVPHEAGAGFTGHPKGLLYLAFTEAWERFSYYGMTALLVLYMVNQLLLPGHVENIVGFAGFLAAGGTRVHPVWPILYCAGMGIAFLYYWPTLLALVSRGKRASLCVRPHKRSR